MSEISLRDTIAIEVMKEKLRARATIDVDSLSDDMLGKTVVDWIAAQCYAMADAMLEAGKPKAEAKPQPVCVASPLSSLELREILWQTKKEFPELTYDGCAVEFGRKVAAQAANIERQACVELMESMAAKHYNYADAPGGAVLHAGAEAIKKRGGV